MLIDVRRRSFENAQLTVITRRHIVTNCDKRKDQNDQMQTDDVVKSSHATPLKVTEGLGRNVRRITRFVTGKTLCRLLLKAVTVSDIATGQPENTIKIIIMV